MFIPNLQDTILTNELGMGNVALAVSTKHIWND